MITPDVAGTPQTHAKALVAVEEEIYCTLCILHELGEVIELRVPNAGSKGTVSGYFNDFRALARAAARLEGHVAGIYITAHRIRSELLARGANRVIERAKQTTSDADVVAYRWLPIDVDPVRSAGISSTDGEHEAALEMAARIADWLVGEIGFVADSIVQADSGNGAHVLVRIDEQANTATATLIARCLQALDLRWSTDDVQIDTSVSNPARIWRLYGTLSAKGDGLPDRPHRRSRIIQAPDMVGVTPGAMLERLAAIAPVDPEPDRFGRGFDLAAWLAQHGIEVKSTKSWQGGTLYRLAKCPMAADEHGVDSAAFAIVHRSGKVSAGCHHSRCRGWGWRELRERYEPASTRYRQHGGRQDRGQDCQEASAGEVTDWLPLEPLPNELPEVPAFADALLPTPLRAWAADAAERLQIAPEMVAVPMMVALAALVGRTVGIFPKRYDDWIVVPNLWGMIVGRPGVLKTPAVREAMRFVRRLAAEASERYRKASEAAEIEQESIKAQRLAAKNEVVRAARRKTVDLDEYREKLRHLRDQEEAVEPVERRYTTQDATVEKLGEILLGNPRGVLLLRDELSGWLRNLDKPGREGDREFFLESWNGDGAFTVDRIGRGTLHIPALCISVMGTIQPGKLRSYLAAAAEGGAGDDGLVQRFQLAVWPDSLGEWRNVDRWPDSAARERAWRIHQRLDQLDAAALGATADAGDIPALRWVPEAQELFDAWRSELEVRLRSPGLEAYPIYEAHLAKYRSLMPTLALLRHLVDVVDGSVEPGRVSLDAARTGAAWIEYLEPHARRLYAVELDPGRAGAKVLAEHILAGDVPDGESLRDVQHREWSQLRSSGQVEAAVDVLAKQGWVRVERSSTGGRPSKLIRLHPELREQRR